MSDEEINEEEDTITESDLVPNLDMDEVADAILHLTAVISSIFETWLEIYHPNMVEVYARNLSEDLDSITLTAPKPKIPLKSKQGVYS